MPTKELHQRLVVTADTFLKSQGCTDRRQVPTMRLFDGRRLYPDAYGARPGFCAVVEAKASRQDFLSSLRKYEHLLRRRRWSPVAQFHYIMVPDRAIARGLPHGWGLLEWGKIVVKAPCFRCGMKKTGNWICLGLRAGGEKILEELYADEYQHARISVGRDA